MGEEAALPFSQSLFTVLERRPRQHLHPSAALRPGFILPTCCPMTREKMICRILLLLILTSCVSGSFVVNVTQTSYQAEENHNITLEWTFLTTAKSNSNSLSIICEKEDDNTSSVLYHVHEGVEMPEVQDKRFSGRVQSDKDALREGRIRLQLSRLRTDDSGLYLCEVNTDYGFHFDSCRLNVTAAAAHSLHKRSIMSLQSESWDRTVLYPLLGLAPALVTLISAFRRHNRFRRR
ncbi:uncharacterized protein LOC115796764 isoform X2 [Archocentrus centrarchus]|uniref:uncharacterized protein LOC115796764 isoform X2 n=1 Tax=Archocentrus centrarchus TaxID=63155 RepID=UPI0011EA4FB8|nr:uncharacterized protein LOC115796764 isoform X2 [Archocentrus centrarchus]